MNDDGDEDEYGEDEQKHDDNLDKEGDGDEDGEDEHAAQTVQVESPPSTPARSF